MSMCLLNCLSQEVKKKLTPDCKTESALLAELDRQYGMKDRVINQILSDVMTLSTPLVENAEKCALFYRGILSAVNDLKDFDSEQCLKNPAVVATLVRHKKHYLGPNSPLKKSQLMYLNLSRCPRRKKLVQIVKFACLIFIPYGIVMCFVRCVLKTEFLK